MEDALARKLITYFNMKSYCEEELFYDLRQSLRELLTHIATSGELDRHWQAMQKANELIRHKAKKQAIARKKLEMGDHYDSGNEDHVSETVEEEDSEDYDSEYTISERSQESERVGLERSETFGPNDLDGIDVALSPKQDNQSSYMSLNKRNRSPDFQQSHSATLRGSQYAGSSATMSKRDRALSKKFQEQEQPFNALRYIASALKAKTQERMQRREDEKARQEAEEQAYKRAQMAQELLQVNQEDKSDDSNNLGISINVNIYNKGRPTRGNTFRVSKVRDGNSSAAGGLTPRSAKKGRDITFDYAHNKEDVQNMPAMPKVSKMISNREDALNIPVASKASKMSSGSYRGNLNRKMGASPQKY